MKGCGKLAFVQLQVMSSYSLLESPTTIKGLVAAAKERGYSALALTDQQVLYASVDFYKACIAAKIKPILGLKLLVSGLLDSENQYPLVILAKDKVGYQHLLKLSTAVMTTEKPLTLADIGHLLSHVFVITPAYTSELATLAAHDLEQAQTYLTKLAKITSDLRIGISLQKQGIALKEPLKQLSDTTQIPLVALEDVRYLEPDDAFSTTILRSIKAGTTLNAEQQVTAAQDGENFLAPATQVFERYQANNLAPAALETEKIAQACQVKLTFHEPLLPKYPVPTHETAADYLRQMATTGLKGRFADKVIPPAYQTRLDHELKVINEMGFNDYFLIIWDVMHYAHQVNIMTGPGRGSAAGALVSYALAITEVDPLKYNLLFERFLNQERHNMPDIDLDIPDNRREDLLQYVHQKYGHTHMAQIITFGTLAAKQALRDVGRVLGLTQFEMADWSKAVPNILHINLTDAYKQSLRLRNLVSDSKRNQLVYKTALRLEGLPRHYSTHAAGIVLADQDLTDYLPLQTGSEGILLTQLPMGNVEELGLLKMDFLGLRNLSILANTLQLVKQQTGESLPINQIPLNDPETLNLFQAGDTNGVFQFESSGIKNVLRELKPTSFEDIVAVNALYRPGPMENIATFIKRKHANTKPEFPNETIAGILGPTYGILVYQEQVMQVAAAMGGFSLGEADILRRAMSKKKKAVIDEKKAEFISGALKKGYQKQAAAQMYEYIERFANYGFNRSHAVAYSMIAFQLAYLKTHYPAAFFAALLNSAINNPTKTKSYLQEAKLRRIKILPPDINQSQLYYRLKQQAILFGLLCIKGLRREFVLQILANRKKQGQFKSLQDFLQRIDAKWLKMDYLAPLVYTEAFTQFNANRAELMQALPELIEALNLSGANVSLFETLAPKKKAVPDLSLAEKLEVEDRYLGAYLSGHPVEKYTNLLTKQPIDQVSALVVGKRSSVLLFVKKIKVIRTKRGEQMAFLSTSDATADLDVTVFPRVYRQISQWLANDQVLLVQGKVANDRGELQLLAEQIQLADNLLPKKTTQTLFLRVTEQAAAKLELPQRLKKSNGPIPVVLFDPTTKNKILLHRDYWVTLTTALTQDLQKLLGKANVAVTNQELSHNKS